MNILVTGHSGFVGGNLVKKLEECGHRVFGIHIIFRRETVMGNLTLIDFDDINLPQFSEKLRENQIDGIIHLATRFIEKHTLPQVADLIDSNLRFGTLLLDSAKEAGVRWFLNTGTYWQYYRSNGYSPVNLYAAIKHGFETIAQYYIETGAIHFITLILFDTYGPGDTRPKLLNQWQKVAETGEPYKMTGGGQILKINFIDDVTEAFLTLAELLQNNSPKIKNGQIYSIDTQRDYTLRQLAEIYESTLEVKLNIEWGSLPYRDREIMKPSVCGEPIPDWKPQTGIREGLKKSYLPVHISEIKKM